MPELLPVFDVTYGHGGFDVVGECFQFSVGDGVGQGDTLCSVFFGILTVYDMMRAETTAAAEYGTADGDNHAVPVMYADDLNVLAPADDIDAAAAVHRNYPGELTDGTACCTSMTVAEIEAYLVRNGIRKSFDTIIGSDTPVEERGFVSVGHPVGTPEFVRACSPLRSGSWPTSLPRRRACAACRLAGGP